MAEGKVISISQKGKSTPTNLTFYVECIPIGACSGRTGTAEFTCKSNTTTKVYTQLLRYSGTSLITISTFTNEDVKNGVTVTLFGTAGEGGLCGHIDETRELLSIKDGETRQFPFNAN